MLVVRTPDSTLNTLILETPKSGNFFGGFGGFYQDFSEAPADGQFLSRLGIRPF